MRKKSVLILHPHFVLPGGAGRFALETARQLYNRGWDVHIACIVSRDGIVKDFKELTFHHLGGPLSDSVGFWLHLPRLLRNLTVLLKELNPDILFSQVFPANWWGFILKMRNPGLSHVWMCQEPSAFIHSDKWINALPMSPAGIGARILNPILKFIDVKLSKYVDYVFSNSEFSKTLAINAYSYPKDLLGICYPGVDLQRFESVDDGGSPKADSVIMCGRITRFKNVDKTIRAVASSLSNIPDITLTLVGEGEERLNLEMLVQKLELEKVVTFYGAVTDDQMVSLLQNHTVLVHAAEQEPFGLAPIEAMSCGLPVIAIKGGGPAETVIDRQTGYLCDDASAENIKQALGWVLARSQHKRVEMSQAARLRANVFSWSNAVDVLEEKFFSLLASGQSKK